MIYKNLTLDSFQEESINHIHQNHSVVVSAPTGSGKTIIADYLINKDLNKKKVIYTAPIKALSNQKFREFIHEFGMEHVGLITGDVVINPNVSVLIMTTEIYRNMVMEDDPVIKDVNYVVFDEIHYLGDPERGTVWEEAIIFSPPHIRFLCLSATIPNADEFAQWIQQIKKHPVHVVKHEKRPVPLKHYVYDVGLGITTIENLSQATDKYKLTKPLRLTKKHSIKQRNTLYLLHILTHRHTKKSTTSRKKIRPTKTTRTSTRSP
jgi:superfamily II RNA helicase